MQGIGGVMAASSGEEYLLVFWHQSGLYWQRIDLDGEPIDPNPRRLLANPYFQDHYVAWNGRHYVIFRNDGLGIVQARISRSGDWSIARPGTLGTIQESTTSGGETALITADWGASDLRLTLFDDDGKVIREKSGLPRGPHALFRTRFGWRRLESVVVNNRLVGPRVIDAESGEVVIPLVGEGRLGYVTPSPQGGLFLYGLDSGLALVIADEEKIHRVENFTPHIQSAKISAHRDGWTVLYSQSGETWLANIGLDGVLTSNHQIVLPPDRKVLSFSSFVSASPFHHLLFAQQTAGLEVLEIDGHTVRVRTDLGMFDAAQSGARIAFGPGLDLVVWREHTGSGWTVRASRIQNGMPLDGEGLLLGTIRETWAVDPDDPAVVFDGAAFLVAWIDLSRSLMVRRVGVDGTLFEAREPIAMSGSSNLRLASRYDGTALLTSSTFSGIVGSLIVHGVPGPPIFPLFPAKSEVRNHSSSFDGAHFLVTGGTNYSCQLLCPSPNRSKVWTRILNPDGTPAGAPALLDEADEARGGRPLPQSDGWIVPVLDFYGLRLFQTSKAGIPHRELRTLGEDLIESSQGPMVWSEHFRGLIDAELRPDWFEPLPIGTGETNGGALSGGEFLLVHDGLRYVIRSAPASSLRADLAVVADRTSWEAQTRLDRIRIQHQGGDVIASMRFGVSGGIRERTERLEIISERPIVDGSIAGPFAPGDVVEIAVRWSRNARGDLFVWALPEARDTDAEDNFLTLPVPERRRLLRRGVE